MLFFVIIKNAIFTYLESLIYYIAKLLIVLLYIFEITTYFLNVLITLNLFSILTLYLAKIYILNYKIIIVIL